MGKYTKEDILKKVKEDDVEFIRLQFTDIFGDLKNVAITSSQIEKALDNKIMFDGSSIEGFARIEESDMYLYPDYDTYETFPWRPQQGKLQDLYVMYISLMEHHLRAIQDMYLRELWLRHKRWVTL